MNPIRHRISITTAADGSATGYTSEPVLGRVLGVVYTKTDFADGSTMTLTVEQTAQPVWAETGVNASAVRYPRSQVHTAAGVAATLDGTVAMLEPVPVAFSRLKLVIASGGNAKTGTFDILVG
jgi:hypothetical protein